MLFITNVYFLKYYENSKFSDLDIDQMASPESFIINSPLEDGDLIRSPLEQLLSYSYALNILIILLVFIFLFIIFNRYVLYNNLKFILNTIEKYMPTTIYLNLQKRISQGINYNNKFILIIFIFNSILLFILLIMNLYVTSELILNIDEYVKVYNHINVFKKS